MMIRKVFLTLAASLFLVFGAYAQTGADSVRIKLKTTAGADLSIDGEFSSTNIMTIKVPVGSHKVKIKYGTSFERDYDIVVSQGGKTEFDFPIEGSCSISCTPPAQLVLDGIPQGMTPQTLNVVGTHNIKIYGDEVEYYDMTDQITVKPFEEIARSYTLRKRPPRLYGMLLANYSSCGAFGGTFAVCRNWGFYIRGVYSGYENSFDDYPSPVLHNGQMVVPTYKKEDEKYALAAVGVMKRISKSLYAYLGVGYGSYCQRYNLEDSEENYEIPYRFDSPLKLSGNKGVAGDIGVIFKYRALLLQVGYATILGEKFGEGKWHHDPYVGIGISLHKQKKSQR
ncbi:MAG: PEGA domain-containing protein [Bacteroidales bacterium]|nr:PEGA domain-containing protein [Bacteroidales bacterium]